MGAFHAFAYATFWIHLSTLPNLEELITFVYNQCGAGNIAQQHAGSRNNVFRQKYTSFLEYDRDPQKTLYFFAQSAASVLCGVVVPRILVQSPVGMMQACCLVPGKTSSSALHYYSHHPRLRRNLNVCQLTWSWRGNSWEYLAQRLSNRLFYRYYAMLFLAAGKLQLVLTNES